MMWRIEMFGGLALQRLDAPGGEREGERITRFRTRKAAALLARLALDERAVPREVLADGLWPDAAPNAGRNNLRVALASLRRQMEPPGVPAGVVLQADRFAVALDTRLVRSDVRDFMDLLRQARSTPDATLKAALLKRACEMYRPPLLPGFYEDWVSEAESRLEALFVLAAKELAALARDCGDAAAESHWAQAAARIGQPEMPHEETPRVAAPSSSAPASTAPDAQEAGFPTPSNPRANAAISQVEAPGVSGALGAAMLFPALPPRWSHLFGREEERAAVLQSIADGERLVTLHGMGGCGKSRLALEIAHELRARGPVPPEDLDVSATDARPFDGTALGAEFDGVEFDGVAWVALANVSRPEEVANSIAAALHLESAREQPPLEAVAAALEGRRVLLVLDNFEQVEEGGEQVLHTLLQRLPQLQMIVTSRRRLHGPAEQAIAILPLPVPQAHPDSSEPSGVAGPAQVLAPGPQAEEAEAELASVQMFVSRARAARADFALTASNRRDVLEVVRLLQGLPLAIELAGARAGSLSPRAMKAQMSAPLDFLRARRPHEPRHDALRTCIAWSLRLLTPEQGRFWARLAVFQGGCTLEAAAMVCAEGEARGDAAHALQVLEELRDASMLFFDAPHDRYILFEVLRPFALELLSDEERRELNLAHARYFRSLADDWERQFKQKGRRLVAVEAQYFNMRALVERALEEAEADGSEPEATQIAAAGSAAATTLVEEAWRTVAALTWFWAISGHVQFALRAAEQLLDPARSQNSCRNWVAPPYERARMEMCAGLCALHVASTSRARGHFERALAIFEEIGDHDAQANARNYLGSVAMARAEPVLAREHYAHSLREHREWGDSRHVAIALCCLAAAEIAVFSAGTDKQGHAQSSGKDGVEDGVPQVLERAVSMCEQARVLWRELGEVGSVAWAFSVEGDAASARGSWHLALRCQEHALQLRSRHSNEPETAGPLSFLAYVLLDQLHAARTRNTLASHKGFGGGLADAAGRAELDDTAVLEEAATLLCRSTRLRLRRGWRREILPMLEALAGLAATHNASSSGADSDSSADSARARARVAARALGATEAWRAEMEVFRLPNVDQRWRSSRERVRAALGEEEFQAEFFIGRSLSIEEAARELLALFE